MVVRPVGSTTRLNFPQVSDERRCSWKSKNAEVAFPALTEERRDDPSRSCAQIRQSVMDEKMDIPPVHLRTGTNFRLGSTDPKTRSTGRASGGRSPGALNREHSNHQQQGSNHLFLKNDFFTSSDLHSTTSVTSNQLFLTHLHQMKMKIIRESIQYFRFVTNSSSPRCLHYNRPTGLVEQMLANKESNYWTIYTSAPWNQFNGRSGV